MTFPGKTFKDLIDALIRKYGSGLKKAIMDENGEIKMKLRVVVDQVDFSLMAKGWRECLKKAILFTSWG